MNILLGIISAVVLFIFISRWLRKPLENIKPEFEDDNSLPSDKELEITETGVIRKYPQVMMEGENLMVFYNGLLMSSGIGTLLAECNTVNDSVYMALVESCNEYFLFEFNENHSKDRLTLLKNKPEAMDLFHRKVEDLKTIN